MWDVGCIQLSLYDLHVWCDFKILKRPTIYLDPAGVHKKSDSACKNTSIKHLKIEIEFFGSAALGSWPCVRFST